MKLEDAIKKVVENIDFCMECKTHGKMRFEYNKQSRNYNIRCENLNHYVLQINANK